MSKSKRPAGVRFTVFVTKEVIASGVAGDSTHCMIADAVKASFPGAQRVSVDLATIRFTDPKKGVRYTFLTPRTAQFLLVQFDDGIRPEPFQFQLRQPHVTKAGAGSRRVLTEAQKAGIDKNAEDKGNRMQDVMRKTGLRRTEESRWIPGRVGGETPPLARGKDGIPFSHRRRFGLRALDL